MENYDIENELIKQFEKEREKYKRPNILICGYSGSGKTSIIQSLLGEDLVPQDKIVRTMTKDYEIYENEMIRIWDSKGLEPDKGEDEFINRTKDFIRTMQDSSKNIDDHIHIFWYVINGAASKVTQTDLKFIEIFPKELTLILISKADLIKERQFNAIKEMLIEHTGIQDDRIICVSDIESGRKGIEELYETSLKIFPDAYRYAFEEAQRIDIEKAIEKIKEKKQQALNIIKTSTVSIVALNLPPLLNASRIIQVQTVMIAGLAALYNLDREQLQKDVLPLLVKTLEMMESGGITKLIPIVNNILNYTTVLSVISALGHFVQEQFERIAIAKVKGETQPTINFDYDVFMEYFKQYQKTNK